MLWLEKAKSFYSPSTGNESPCCNVHLVKLFTCKFSSTIHREIILIFVDNKNRPVHLYNHILCVKPDPDC